MNRVGPHVFERRGFFRRYECRACYYTKDRHPINHWVIARPLGSNLPPLEKQLEKDEKDD